jgi:hypothetical protein
MCSHRVADSLPIDISFSNMNQVCVCVCVCVDLKLPVDFLQFVWRNSAVRKVYLDLDSLQLLHNR